MTSHAAFRITLAAVALALCLSLPAAVQKGKSRPLKTGNWMKLVVKPNCGALKKGIDAGPSTDEAWADLAAYAGVLNETSHVLMADGRCPDGVWAGATKTLREGSAAVLKATDDKDAAAAAAAFKSMTGSCKACHDKHKKKK